MANSFLISSKPFFALVSNNVQKISRIPLVFSPRYLYAKAALGLDTYIDHKTYVEQQMVNIADQFREKMIGYSTENNTNVIFTEDLKNMVHIADNSDDLDLVVKMIKKFNQQNKSLRFGNFVFGPVVMRMFHLHNRPDLAVECFKSPELVGFFDQLSSYQILLDLLYENGQYKEVLNIFQEIVDRQIENAKYPKNVVVLAFAACYKLNSQESLEWALNLYKQLNSAGHFLMRKAVTFCAGLALNQGQPVVALEVISTVRNQNYTTIRNIKAAALADLGRVEDTIPLLKSIISEDRPNEQPHTFNPDVLEKIKSGVLKTDSIDIKSEYEYLEKLFQKQGHIAEITLDQMLCAEMKKPPQTDDFRRQPNKLNRFAAFKTIDRRNTRRTEGFNRPGLNDLL